MRDMARRSVQTQIDLYMTAMNDAAYADSVNNGYEAGW
jgi:hypothetical protein